MMRPQPRARIPGNHRLRAQEGGLQVGRDRPVEVVLGELVEAAAQGDTRDC